MVRVLCQLLQRIAHDERIDRGPGCAGGAGDRTPVLSQSDPSGQATPGYVKEGYITPAESWPCHHTGWPDEPPTRIEVKHLVSCLTSDKARGSLGVACALR